MSFLAAIMSRRRLFPMLLLLCVSLLLSIQFPSVVSSALSFDVQFTKYGFDPQMVLFHQMSPKNISDKPYTAHRQKQVLPRKKRKKFVPAQCDCSRIDGVMYARPAPLRGKAAAADKVASFKMTLCLKLDRTKKLHGDEDGDGDGGRIGLFMFLVPYPWNAHDERIEVGLDSNCTETLMDGIGSSEAAVVCAHVQYDSTTELLLSTVRIGDGYCTCGGKLDRGRMPEAAAPPATRSTWETYLPGRSIPRWSRKMITR